MVNIPDLNGGILIDKLKGYGVLNKYRKFEGISRVEDLYNLSLNELMNYCELTNLTPEQLLKRDYLKILPDIETIKDHIYRFNHNVEKIKNGKNKPGVVLLHYVPTTSETPETTESPKNPEVQGYTALGYNLGKLLRISRTKEALQHGLGNFSSYYESQSATPEVAGTSPAFTTFEPGGENEDQKTAPRADVPEARISANAVPDDAPIVGTAPRVDVNIGYARKLQESKNIPVRTLDTPDDKNSSVRVPSKTAKNGDTANSGNTAKNSISAENSTNAENIALRECVSTGSDFDKLSKIPENFLETANLGVYHNVEEANKIFSRQRKLEKIYQETPEKVAKNKVVNARDGVTCYPTTYNRDNVIVIDSFVDGDYGEFNIYYSVFNKQGDYLFSEVYSCRYDDGEEKSIKYYKRIFFDVIIPGTVFEFTEDEEISRESFYYGIYRQYRCFGFTV